MTTRLIISFPDLFRLSVRSAESGAGDHKASITGMVVEGTPVPGMRCSLSLGGMATAADLVDISWRGSPRAGGPVTLALQCASSAERDTLVAAATDRSVLEGRLPGNTGIADRC